MTSLVEVPNWPNDSRPFLVPDLYFRETMKKRILLFSLSICILASHSTFAKPDKDDKEYTDKKVAEIYKTVSGHETRIHALESSVKNDSEEQNKRLGDMERTVGNQAEAINKLISQLKEVQEKLDITTKAIDEVGGTTEGNQRWVKILLSILIPVVAIILAVLGFAFWPRKVLSPSASTDSSTHPKCPRCGWEHDPKDTVCKNPNCKTQF